ncbi:MAG: hypothetical protein WBD16_00315 [Pyrinomonadaceae bacterium]
MKTLEISKIKFRSMIVLITLAAISAATGFVLQNKTSASGFSGAIYTTTFDGQAVNQNKYPSKDAVYLSGGPQNANANGLPDGIYYFQVTDPSGATLLSIDSAVCRQLVVLSGRVAGAVGPSCPNPHQNGVPNSANGSTPVKLAPFADTPNPGGVYKVWLIRQGPDTTIAADGKHINFSRSDAKTDNFKVVSVPCPDCSLLSGKKYYDANANGLFDEGEVPVEGVQISIVAGPISTVVTTNASGIWSTSVPTGADYTVLEYLPTTGPDGEPGSYWQQSAPAADDEGFQGYAGTASGDQTNLDFGNICFNPDAEGNPVASPSPCPVSDLPPPDPTPTPTPTPCTDCSPTAMLSGKKFYDTNRNALFDEGEVTVQGVQIVVVVVTGDGVTVTTGTTNASGNWSLSVPTGAQYIVSENLPDTDPETEPGGYWEQTAPLPNDEGSRTYSGTASADQTFIFGNVCFVPDSEGEPVLSATPCSIRYPPPLPTP